ncbi:MAG: crotonase/enoyl-CoA hydratase family protein [Polyangiaceae bacterium]
MEDRVVVERRGPVALVELNRADKLNALDTAMFRAIIAAGEELRKAAGLRAVVLAGRGRAFCAGLDVAAFGALAADLDTFLAPYRGGPQNVAQEVAHVWTRLPVPVIAAVQGPCFGGGLQIALGADIRLVHAEAELSVMEVVWGLIPDMIGTTRLRDLVRLDVAKELTFTGRRVKGEEAVRLGLATRVEEDPRAAALALADEIAGRSPDAVRAAKKLLDAAVRVDEATGLAMEAEAQRALIGSKNQLEAVMAKMQKRKPAFVDPQ